MATHTFHIDGSSDKAKALLEFLRTLEYVHEDNDNWYDSLSEESKASIKRGVEDANNGRFVSQDDVQAKVDRLLSRA